MVFTVNQNELVEKVTSAARIIPATPSTPILENLVLRAIDSDKISIIANNLELYLETSIAAMVLEKGEILINGKLFAQLVKKLPPDDITFQTDEETKQLNIQAGKTNVYLAYQSTEAYPKPLEMDTESSYISIQASRFSTALSNTIYAISKTANHNIMSSVNLVLQENTLYIHGLDGHRIARQILSLDNDKESTQSFDVMIPQNTALLLTKYKGDNELSICSSSKHIKFQYQNSILISQLISGKYYNIPELISKNSDFIITINRMQFEECISRTLTLQKEAIPMKIHIGNQELVITYQSSMGKMSESIDLLELNGNVSDKGLDIGFNPLLLLEALKAVSDKDITIGFGNAKCPCIIKNNTYLHLLLPVGLHAA